ncbi:MAG TPA: helix-turn-helix domain-containing protein [Bryobacteraceae bacterium]|nr:helix-turn-helix domain-containing protein [Bryobacteraceae bacterium]
MSSAGELLRQERIKRNRSLSEISASTCISTRYLEAIEQENLAVLPGDFFYRSFIRQYAASLGLESSEIQHIVSLAPRIEEEDPVPALASGYQTAEAESEISGLNKPRLSVAVALLGTVLVGCSGLYALWHQRQVESEMDIPTKVAPAAVPPHKNPEEPARQSEPLPAEDATHPVKPLLTP